MEKFRLIVAGSRSFNNYQLLVKELDFLLSEKIKDGYEIEIVSGHAKGADTLGERYALDRNYAIKYFKAEWQNLSLQPCKIKYNENGPYNVLAGVIRNHQMGLYADAAVLFWDGSSSGTKDMRDYMQELKKPYRVINF